VNKKFFLLLMIFCENIPQSFNNSTQFALLPVSFNNSDEMLLFLKQFLPASPVILEAGANQGEDTLKMMFLWTKSNIHVFEPSPHCFSLLKKHIAAFPLIKSYPYALTNFCGEAEFYIGINEAPASSSIDEPLEIGNSFEKKPIKVPCLTIDEWATQNKISSIDFMWLDMEGHELCALQKATDILKNTKIIYTEVSYEPIRKTGCSYLDLKAFLEKQGFLEVWRWRLGNIYKFGDALFIKKDALLEFENGFFAKYINAPKKLTFLTNLIPFEKHGWIDLSQVK